MRPVSSRSLTLATSLAPICCRTCHLPHHPSPTTAYGCIVLLTRLKMAVSQRNASRARQSSFMRFSLKPRHHGNWVSITLPYDSRFVVLEPVPLSLCHSAVRPPGRRIKTSETCLVPPAPSNIKGGFSYGGVHRSMDVVMPK